MDLRIDNDLIKDDFKIKLMRKFVRNLFFIDVVSIKDILGLVGTSACQQVPVGADGYLRNNMC